LITGASEGIGLAYAFELAKAGFNLTLVSRSIANLEEAQAKINAVNPDVKIRLMPMDMS
jgi:17beta-estradiol 17-dehydrogenase / very-long-chain 3-oxoacyl-CoA reductase